MKKLYIVLLIFALLLSGCSSNDTRKTELWKPKQASKEIRPYIERAIKIIDSYLSFDINQEDAQAAFTELADRMEPLGVTEIDSGYSNADRTAAYEIQSLTYGNKTDLEYRQSRDILAFQIGEDVSGRAYPAEKESDIFEDEPLHRYLKNFDAPVSGCFADELSDGTLHVGLTFDAINGIAPPNLLPYTESLISATSKIIAKSPESKFYIRITYQYYDQGVFYLSIDLDGSTIKGRLSNSSDLIMKFDSIDDLADAIEMGEKYFGNRSVPTGRPAPSKTTTASESHVDILEYPSAIGSEEEKLMIPICPDEIFSTIAEENGLEGTLYAVYGTVTNITGDSDGCMNTIHLRTHKGDVVIQNIVISMSSIDELGTLDKSIIETLCPMPTEGELSCIYAEYQGFSEAYNTPFFIYGSTSYLTDVLLAAVELE